MNIPHLRIHRLALAAVFALCAFVALAPTASAALGRVVAIGDSMASGMGLGTVLPMVNPACGRTSGSYPQLTSARLAESSFEDVTCNGGHTGVFDNTYLGLAIPENNGATIPPQFNSLNGSEQAVIIGTGGNEAYFGEVAFACLGHLPDLDVYAAKLQGQNVEYENNCRATYGTNGAGLLTKVANAESLVGPSLDKAHAKSPNAKIFLVGIPRVAPPDAAGCMPNPILTPLDAPVYALWENELRLAMRRVVAARSSWARFVDVQAISGTSHTTCAAWGQKWINPWSVQPGIANPGIALHNTPAGASAMADAVIDSFHAAGLDTGSQATNPTNPVVQITAPANNLLTKNASAVVNYSATDNLAIASCAPASGSSVSLSEGPNTIVVDCQDHAGNHGVAQVSVTRDSTAPQITNITPTNGTNTTSSSVVLSYNATDAGGTPNCSPASGSSVNLTTGANTVTISCTDAAGNPASASVVINRGSVPAVAINSPVNGQSITTASVNVSFTVNGGSAIPPGTSCTVNAASTSSANTNSVLLSAGPNAITVACTNQFGSGSPVSVSVTGSPPADVAIASPPQDTLTSAASINVAYLVSGESTLPLGTTCSVNAINSTDPTTNLVALSLGSNTITVLCTGAFGAKSASVNVTRGDPPSVAITAPTHASSTGATSTNVAYTVNGAASIPAGTACTINSVSSLSATTNSVNLAVGANTITAQCTNQFGSSAVASVDVTRGVPPVVAITSPADGFNTSSSSAVLAYTVDGQSTIPPGTSCNVNAASSSNPSNHPVSLSLGSNSFTVSCSSTFGSGSDAIAINRGTPPTTTISSPADGHNTAASSVEVAFSAQGAGPTTCTVNGNAAPTSPVTVALAPGANPISVVCSNAFGSGSPATISVNRGAVPLVELTTPTDGLNTTDATIGIGYSVDGSSTSIPAGTTCVAGGAASTDPQPAANQKSLVLGANTVTVTCTNIYGTGSDSVVVTLGAVPTVLVVAPTDGARTTAPAINVSFTVGGASSIPAGTSCTIGGVPTSNPSSNNKALVMGSNSITVACSNTFGNSSKTVTVIRGDGPNVAITSPTNGLKTTQSTVSLSFTVDGGTTLPIGTTCSVDGVPKTTTTGINIALSIGTNVIDVACTNLNGTDERSVTVDRGTAPEINVTAPLDNLHTTANSIALDFTAWGTPQPTCTVNSVPSSAVSTLPLNTGENTFTIFCLSAFGSATKTLHVYRGSPPVVLINAYASSTTPESPVNVTYFMLNHEQSIPAGTTCTVNGHASDGYSVNPLALAVGSNPVSVACTNSFGTGSATVYVTYQPSDPPPEDPAEFVPPAPRIASSLSLKIASKKALHPAKRGGMFSRRGGLPLRIKLDADAKVTFRVERLGAGSRTKSFRLVGSEALELKAGTSTARLSGRVGRRALADGRYRVTLQVAGTKLRTTSRPFRVRG